MDQRETQPAGDRREALRRAPVGRAEDDHREHDFGCQARAEGITAQRVRPETVRRETARQAKAVLTAGDQVQNSGAPTAPSTCAMTYAGRSKVGNRFPTTSPTETAGFR